MKLFIAVFLLLAATLSCAQDLASLVSTHKTPNDCQTVLGGNLYDLSSYLTPNHHPGGVGTVLPCCGSAVHCDQQLAIRHPARYVNFLSKYKINPPAPQNNDNNNGVADSSTAANQPSIVGTTTTTQTQQALEASLDIGSPAVPLDVVDPALPAVPAAPLPPTDQDPNAVPATPVTVTAPSSASLKQILIVDSLNNIVDFDPSQFPGTLNFLPTLQPGVVKQGVNSVVFTAKAESDGAQLTIKVNDLGEKPYINNEPIVVDLAEIKTPDAPTTIQINVVSADGTNKKTYSIVIPPDGQAAINAAAVCIVGGNNCLITTAVKAASNIDPNDPNAHVPEPTPSATANSVGDISADKVDSYPSHLSLGSSHGFITLLIVLSSLTAFFACISLVLFYQQRSIVNNQSIKQQLGTGN